MLFLRSLAPLYKMHAKYPSFCYQVISVSRTLMMIMSNVYKKNSKSGDETPYNPQYTLHSGIRMENKLKVTRKVLHSGIDQL